jgi:hypothetical protein
MAQCIKLFINSLYGKFGEHHHDIEFYMHETEFADDDKFRLEVIKRMRENKNMSNDFDQHLDRLEIKNTPLFDLNNRDKHLTHVKISNAPFLNNHIGAFVYYASLITAIGRT